MKATALALMTLMAGCTPAMAQQQSTCWNITVSPDMTTCLASYGVDWQEGYEVKQGVPR